MRILGLAGSARTGSFNQALLAHALAKLESSDIKTETFSFREDPLPLYDGDLEKEEGIPDAALKLRAAVLAADGLVMACPEYNASITPLLKNALDWGSRKDEETGQGNVWLGKPVLLLSASPGALGGVRSLRAVREVLVELQAHVMPQQVAVPGAIQMFGEDGELAHERARSLLISSLDEFKRYVRRFQS